MASMYGKDEAYMSKPMGQQAYMDPPVYTQTVNVVEISPEDDEVECTPHMCYHHMGLLRWFQLLMFFILQWLVQITCGNDACTMIMNVFGYIAMGQVFVLLILLWMSILCVIILCAYGLNSHRAFPNAILGVEKLYAFSGIILFFIAGILGAWMAGLTVHDEYNYQGRGYAHIRPQWIAAAVIEFLMVVLYIFDFILQRRENYPFTGKEYKQADTQPQYYREYP